MLEILFAMWLLVLGSRSYDALRNLDPELQQLLYNFPGCLPASNENKSQLKSQKH